MPNDSGLPSDRVELLLQQMTYDDWRAHHTLNDIDMLDALGVDAEIAYWEKERAQGRDPYEDREG